MVSLWRSLKKPTPQPYRLAKLVDNRSLEAVGRSGIHVVCDIDKTYLETEFESLIRMARIAFEAASDKITVTGASEVLLLARWGDMDAPLPPGPDGGGFPRSLHFVSSSPPQLRSVLEEKMTLDGLDWSSDTFKNQAYNLRMGRMDLLKQHVAYKSLAILNLIAAAGAGSRFLLIGDNAESDAYIYTGIKLLLEGRLGSGGYQAYLEAAGVEKDVARSLAGNLPGSAGTRVVGVLIRNVPGYVFVAEPPLTDVVQTFDNFFQAALLLMVYGILPASKLWELARSFHNHHGMTRRQIGAMLAAVSGRGAPADLVAAAEEALARLHIDGGVGEPPAALVASLAATSRTLEGMSELDILRHARLWMQRLHAQKGKREPA